jgi:mannitol-1-phosphate 5-dehydrogenase
MKKCYVGFGFGPIQNALFLFEASRSGRFSRYVVGEVDAALVWAVRENGGAYTVNVARRDGIEPVTVAGVELYNPRMPGDREELVDAIEASDEMATALPSVDIYMAGGESSVVRLIRDGVARRASPRPTIVYAAENHNHAAEILTAYLAQEGCREMQSLQVLNTVIGKMSGVITDAATIARLGLKTMTPKLERAVLVEEFNQILVSQVRLPGYERGISAFVEKPDLLPFEEAKLYGHNAIHALIGYLAELKGLATIADAGRDAQIMGIARTAFLDECGTALVKRHGALNDPLFTRDGFRAFAEDLLERMVNPHLNDLVARVGRDHVRKLGWDDRLYGTMRVALSQGVQPANLALGAAAGVVSLLKHAESAEALTVELPAKAAELTRAALAQTLVEIWQGKADHSIDALVNLTWEGLQKLRADGWPGV